MWSGTGARNFGGRWNSKGISVIYVSGSISLAAIEILVHLDSAEVLTKFVKCPVTFDSRLVTHLDISKLPRNWRSDPGPAALRTIGDSWVAEERSVILAVPSAVVADEWNYVINPGHRDFGKIKIGKAEGFGFDRRLA
jgi:RES domain-containing protein